MFDLKKKSTMVEVCDFDPRIDAKKLFRNVSDRIEFQSPSVLHRIFKLRRLEVLLVN